MTPGPVLALLIFAGLIGGASIALLFRRGTALLLTLAWLAVPYVGLAILLANDIDPSLAPERAAYNLQLGFAIYSIILSAPWLGSNLAGWVMGKLIRGRMVDPAGATPAAVSPRAQDAAPIRTAEPLPDWSFNDRHREQEMMDRLRGLCERLGIPGGERPLLDAREGRSEEIRQDKFDMIYYAREGDRIVDEFATVNTDAMLYHIFRGYAQRAAAREVPYGTGGNSYTDALLEREHAILAAADPLWGNQFTYECSRPR